MARKSYSDKEREQVKEALLITVLESIVNQGLVHSSIAILCEKVGISKTFFYSFFSSKEELVMQALRYQQPTQASPRKKKKRDSFPQIPTWLEGHVKERKQKRLPTVTLCSSAGNELLEVWYYGELLTVKGESQSYIIDRGETPGLVAARDPESGEEFVIFDGGQHGYDNMFCDEHNPAQLAHRPLQRYEIPASKLVLELGYNIDYEDEKESFEVDEADTVELVNGERMPWEQVKRDGIDYIALYYVNDKGKQLQILDAELA